MRLLLPIFVVVLCCCLSAQTSFAQKGKQTGKRKKTPSTKSSTEKSNEDERVTIEFGPTDQQPEPITPIESLVEYPYVAKRAGMEDNVIVSVLIDVDGSVKKVVAEKWDYEIFRDAAIDALHRAKFTPAVYKGKVVKLWIVFPVIFRLNGFRVGSTTDSILTK